MAYKKVPLFRFSISENFGGDYYVVGSINPKDTCSQ